MAHEETPPPLPKTPSTAAGNLDDPHVAAVVAARQKLMRRFQKIMRQTPGVADDRPQGTGPANRHGMPLIPVGQTKTDKWPVLDLGTRPGVTRDTFRLVVDGAVDTPLSLWSATARAFWEERGYSMTAHPWRNDRYGD